MTNAGAGGSWTSDSDTQADASGPPPFPFPVQPMTARRQLRLAAVHALKEANLSVEQKTVTVDSPGNWPYPQQALPAVCVRAPGARKESLNKGNTDYTTSVTIEVRAAVTATTAEAAQDALEALELQIEEKILTDFYVLELVQNVTSIETAFDLDAKKSQVPVAGAVIRFEFETVEVFQVGQALGTLAPPAEAPPPTTLTEITVDVTQAGSVPPYSPATGDPGLALTLPGD